MRKEGQEIQGRQFGAGRGGEGGNADNSDKQFHLQE